MPTFRVEREKEMIHSFGGNLVKDPNWNYIDAAGHEHTYDTDSYKSIDQTLFFDDGDGRVDEVVNTRFECLRCGEHLVPGTTLKFGPIPIFGMAHYYVDDEQVTEEEYMRRFEEALLEAQKK